MPGPGSLQSSRIPSLLTYDERSQRNASVHGQGLPLHRGKAQVRVQLSAAPSSVLRAQFRGERGRRPARRGRQCGNHRPVRPRPHRGREPRTCVETRRMLLDRYPGNHHPVSLRPAFRGVDLQDAVRLHQGDVPARGARTRLPAAYDHAGVRDLEFHRRRAGGLCPVRQFPVPAVSAVARA